MNKIISKYFLIISYTMLCFHTSAQNNELEKAKKLFIDLRANNEAKKLFDEIINNNPSEEEAYYYRGQLHSRLMNFHAAKKDFNQAIELDSRYADNYYQRGLVLIQLQDYKAAIQDFNKAISLAKNTDDYYVARANAFRLSQRYDRALKDCDKAIQLNNKNGLARSIKGMTYWNMGDQRASSFFIAANQTSSNNIDLARTFYYTALYYEGIGKNEQALKNYEYATKFDKIPIEYYFGKANLELKLQNYKVAKKTANIIIQKQRMTPSSYVVRAICNYKTNAKEDFDRDIHFFFEWATQNNMTDPEGYISEKFYKYLVENSPEQDEVLLKHIEIWLQNAIKKNNSISNNILLAKLYIRNGRSSQVNNLLSNINSSSNPSLDQKNEIARLIDEASGMKQDNTPPRIEITSPVFQAKRGVIIVEVTKKIIIKGKVTDESGIKSVTINGNPARLHFNGEFEGRVTLSKGDNLIKIKAQDRVGNANLKSFVIKKEEQPIAEKQQTIKKKNDFSRLGKHRALLFATDIYDEWGNLNNPIFDAEAIARDLERIYGFSVEIVRNATGSEVIEKLREYHGKEYGSGSELFIFFAGHGQYDELLKEGYIVVKDSKLNEASKFSYISHSNIRKYINSIPCDHIFLTLDVCFGGTIDPIVASRGEEQGVPANIIEHANKLLYYKTRIYLTSGGKEYVKDGKRGQHSPFVRKFLTALRKGGGDDGILTADEIIPFYKFAEKKPQYGEFDGNEPGSNFIFVRRP